MAESKGKWGWGVGSYSGEGEQEDGGGGAGEFSWWGAEWMGGSGGELVGQYTGAGSVGTGKCKAGEEIASKRKRGKEPELGSGHINFKTSPCKLIVPSI